MTPRAPEARWSPEERGRPDDVPTAAYPRVARGVVAGGTVAGTTGAGGAEVAADPAETTAETTGEARPLARRRRRRRLQAVVAASALVVSVALAAIASLGLGGPSMQPPRNSGAPPATATVTRMTLTQTERLAGTLGYGPVRVLVARASAMPTSAGLLGHPAELTPNDLAEPSATPTPTPSETTEPTSEPTLAPTANPTTNLSSTPPPTPVTTNTITWMPPVGALVGRNQPVYKVDNQPVVLFIGDTPLYRVLTEGLVGPDVRVLEENLVAFGYTGLTVDESFTSATAAMVRRWQRDLGLPQTGTVDVNRVVVAPAELRVAEHRASVGLDATGEVLAYTGTTPVVTLDVPVGRRHLVQVGQSVTLTLPDGRTVGGTVASVGTVAAAAQDGGGAPTVEAEVTIADQADLGGFDAAPVGLSIVVAERADVLTVPVGALVALAEGGYGVQVIEGSNSHYVAVETGMFAMGQVEITGVEEGTVVGVPA